MFSPYFETKLDWEGVVDRKPEEDEFQTALLNKQMLIYIGHGGGAQYFDLEKISDDITAASLLMGCSSGVLPHQGLFEPQGVAIQYLIRKCPCVVANLWDVTDKDIDRFLLDFLQRFVDKKESLGESVARAR